MEWTIEYETSSRILIASTNGKYSAANGRELVRDVARQADKYGSNTAVVDLSQAEVGLTITDWYDRPTVYEEEGLSRRVALALIFSEVGEDEQFYENVCRNRGYEIRVFDDREAGKRWLLGLGG